MNMIVCVDCNNGIGYEGELLFRIKSDMRRFRALTETNIVLMGLETAKTLTYGKLLNRKNWILTSNRELKSEDPEVIYFHSVKDVLLKEKATAQSIFCIGGASIYEQFLPYVKEINMTKVFAEKKADRFFPHLNEREWKVNYSSKLYNDEGTGLNFQFIDYIRA